MRQYQSFILHSYRLDIEEKRIDLTYSLDDEVWFTESVQLPATPGLTLTPEVDRALFALHLAGGVSYYKTCVPRTLTIRSGSLTEAQAAFWTTLYERGLGEFFFRNDIDFRGLIGFPHVDGPAPAPLPASPDTVERSRFLVPVG